MMILIALLLAQAPQHPCLDDAKRLCQGIEPGQGRIAACLKAHKDQLSPGCTERIEEFREGAAACQADVEKLCPGMGPGPERRRCMQQHREQITPGCRALFQQGAERREESREALRACRADAQKLCRGVKPGEGRVAECLKQHRGELSPGCASRIP